MWPRGFHFHDIRHMKVVRSSAPTHRPPLPPGNVPGTHFHYGLSRPQGHVTIGRNMSLKNPVTPAGIDPGTVRLVAQRLKNILISINIVNHNQHTLYEQLKILTDFMIVIPTGESNGKLPLRTCPGCSVPEPYQSPDWALVSAQTGPRAEYQ